MKMRPTTVQQDDHDTDEDDRYHDQDKDHDDDDDDDRYHDQDKDHDEDE